MFKKKEPNFFSLEGVDPDSYEFPEARAYHFESVYEKAPYLDLFKDAPLNQAAGENSNPYMVEERTAKRIQGNPPRCPDHCHDPPARGPLVLQIPAYAA